MKLIRPYLFPADLVFFFFPVCVCVFVCECLYVYTLKKLLTILCFSSSCSTICSLPEKKQKKKQPLAEQITQRANSSKQNISISLAARFNVALWDELPAP